MIKIGIIGCGHWGPNHIRIFSGLKGSQVVQCADLDEGRLSSIRALYPGVQTTANPAAVFGNDAIAAVCIATPTSSHYALVKEALGHNKHVLCEKPLALKPEECDQLYELAKEKNKVLMVGHIFVFNDGIIQLKNYIDSGELGNIYYAHSIRTNLGPFRYDVNALWDLAPHDISIFNYLFGGPPVRVSACGKKFLGPALEDIAFATLEYPGNILVSIHVSWLDPKKVRQITVVGDKKMVLWDDLDNLGPIKLYDKHVEKTSMFYETYGEFQLLSREGSIVIPKVKITEPLKTQNQFFLDCIEGTARVDIVDAHAAADVVKALCAIQESMNNHGAPVSVT